MAASTVSCSSSISIESHLSSQWNQRKIRNQQQSFAGTCQHAFFRGHHQIRPHHLHVHNHNKKKMEHLVHASVEVPAAETTTASSIEITEIPIEKRTLVFSLSFDVLICYCYQFLFYCEQKSSSLCFWV